MNLNYKIDVHSTSLHTPLESRFIVLSSWVNFISPSTHEFRTFLVYFFIPIQIFFFQNYFYSFNCPQVYSSSLRSRTLITIFNLKDSLEIDFWYKWRHFKMDTFFIVTEEGFWYLIFLCNFFSKLIEHAHKSLDFLQEEWSNFLE